MKEKKEKERKNTTNERPNTRRHRHPALVLSGLTSPRKLMHDSRVGMCGAKATSKAHHKHGSSLVDVRERNSGNRKKEENVGESDHIAPSPDFRGQ